MPDNTSAEVVSTITSKGQVTVPRSIRDELGVRPGDKIAWIKGRNGVAVKKKVNLERVKKWRGYLKDLAGKDIDEVVREMRGH
jgi:AbrB family looped-hinge helix DNA binding protein